MPKNRREKRQTKIENALNNAAAAIHAATALYRRAPESTTLTMFSRTMIVSLEKDIHYLANAAKRRNGASA